MEIFFIYNSKLFQISYIFHATLFFFLLSSMQCLDDEVQTPSTFLCDQLPNYDPLAIRYTNVNNLFTCVVVDY